MTYYAERQLYRSRRGAILGVCRGVANYLEVPTGFVRLAAVLLIFVFGPLTILGYFVGGLLMKPEPVLGFDDSAGEAAFGPRGPRARGMTTLRLKDTYEQLDRRLQRLESVVTSRDFDWESRLKG